MTSPTPAHLRRRLRKTGTALRVTQVVTTCLLVVFVVIGVWAAVHRNFIAAALASILAIVCFAVLFFARGMRRQLPSLHRQLTDYEHGPRGDNDDVN
jgi:uncharacterized membrane protein